MGVYRSKRSHFGKTAEARAAQLANLKQRHKVKPITSEGFIRCQKSLSDYADDPLGFVEAYFYVVEGRKPIKLLSWQKELLTDLFCRKVRPNLAVIGQPKKTGKSTLAAAIALWFLITKPMSETYLLASDVEQSQLVCFDKLCKSIRMNPLLRDIVKIRPGKNYIEYEDSVVRILSPNTSVAGINPSLVIAEELWSWTTAEHKRSWDELTCVPTREENLNLVTSYAGFSEDEDSILWLLYKSGIDQAEGREEPDERFLFRWFGEELYSQVPWVKPAYLPLQRKRLRENSYKRLHCNMWASSEEAFVDALVLDACTNLDCQRGHEFDKPVVVGVDIGLKHDSSAITLVGKIDSETLAVVDHACFVPVGGQTLDLEKTVEAMLLIYQKRYEIRAIYYDPFQFARSAKTLQGKGLRLVEYCQTVQNTVAMTECLSGLLHNQNLILYESAELRQHLLNASIKETQRGYRLVKKRQSKLIDLAVSLAMAVQGCQELLLLQTAAGFKVVGDDDLDEDDYMWTPLGTYAL